MRVGVFGGSFDPIHLGHAAAALAVRRARRLETVFLVPAARPPHKEGCLAPFADRCEMARLAVESLDGLEVLDLEGDRAGPSYTVDTLEALRRRDPDREWDLLVGADMLEDLPRWHRAAEIPALAEVVAFARPGVETGAAVSAFEQAFHRPPAAVLEVPGYDTSSSGIRRALAAGEPVAGHLAPAVWTYIRKRRLYGFGDPAAPSPAPPRGPEVDFASKGG